VKSRPDVRARALALARALASSRWVRPAARILALGAGLALLALIGRSTLAGAEPGSAPASIPMLSPTPNPSPSANPTPTSMPSLSQSLSPTPEQPLILNTATADELQRLPGIGPKRADAIVALRQRQGRLRQIEDLLKVKGIGRATLRRLRPLVRIDPPPQPKGPPDASA
jgi:competence protein ComEA